MAKLGAPFGSLYNRDHIVYWGLLWGPLAPFGSPYNRDHIVYWGLLWGPRFKETHIYLKVSTYILVKYVISIVVVILVIIDIIIFIIVTTSYLKNI